MKHKRKGGNKRIRHKDIWGLREIKSEDKQTIIGGKYNQLNTLDISTTDFNDLTPESPFYTFKIHNRELSAEYEELFNLPNILKVNSTGVKTHRDHFVIDFDINTLVRRIKEFRNLEISDYDIRNKYNLKDNQDWKLNLKRQYLAADMNWNQRFTQCLYRPFDLRHYYHSPHVVDRSRNEVMHNMINRDNLGLICSQSSC
ncbi:MAG: hypothetical protein H8E46_10640 [FCB group bacterium]|nr:hypothetical protein [FCB group bacterium]